MENSYTDKKSSNIRELGALIRWSLLRHKTMLPIFTVVQAFLSLAIVCGIALMIPDVDKNTAIYLSSGAATIGVIAVGCVLAAQIVNTAKQDGIVQYQRTLPVSRTNILIADFIIWGLASLPGVFMSFLAAYLRFGVTTKFSLINILILIVVQMCMISIGFSIAYWFSPDTVGLISQIIMIGGLLFSPIIYPSSRIPETIKVVYDYLPFVPAGNIIRSSFFGLGEFKWMDLVVIIIWTLVTYVISLTALSKRS